MTSRSGKYRGGNRNHEEKSLASVARETALALPADSPVLAMFKSAAWKLTDRQDRHEKLIKLSRDITIESKRVIFLLHSAIKEEDQKKSIHEATGRLDKLIKGPIKAIGLELEMKPAYLHSRAVSAGFQEFIEAYTFCYLLKEKEIATFAKVQKEFEYTIKERVGDVEVDRVVTSLLLPTDYILGLADLTGELMRRAINSISSGSSEECFQSCQLLRELYTGFLGLFGTGKEIARKLNTTRANVAKVETAMYALRVRGNEAPPKLLLPALNDWEMQPHHSDDEGYY